MIEIKDDGKTYNKQIFIDCDAMDIESLILSALIRRHYKDGRFSVKLADLGEYEGGSLVACIGDHDLHLKLLEPK